MLGQHFTPELFVTKTETDLELLKSNISIFLLSDNEYLGNYFGKVKVMKSLRSPLKSQINHINTLVITLKCFQVFIADTRAITESFHSNRSKAIDFFLMGTGYF